jgi:hypothetical protein
MKNLQTWSSKLVWHFAPINRINGEEKYRDPC